MYEVGSLAYVVRNGVTVQKCHVTRAEDDMRIVELESGALSMLRITELYPTYESADTSIPQEEDGRKGVPA